jgi:hypothetical protein
MPHMLWHGALVSFTASLKDAGLYCNIYTVLLVFFQMYKQKDIKILYKLLYTKVLLNSMPRIKELPYNELILHANHKFCKYRYNKTLSYFSIAYSRLCKPKFSRIHGKYLEYILYEFNRSWLKNTCKERENWIIIKITCSTVLEVYYNGYTNKY